MALLATKEETEQVKQQLLKLFAPGERVGAAEISIRLEEKTGGRKVFQDSKVITLLNALVKEGKLSQEEVEKDIRGHTINIKEYFLP